MNPSGTQLIIPMVPPGRHDSDQFVGGRLMMRCEHRTHRRHHHVETVVRERQCLRVGLDPFQVDAMRGGDPTPGVEQLRREITRGDDSACRGGRDSGVAGAGGDVQHTIPRPHAACRTSSGPSAGISSAATAG